MSIERCILEIENVAGKLTEAERTDLTEQVGRLVRRAERQAPDDVEGAVLRSLEDFTDEQLSLAAIEKRNAMLNFRKELESYDYVRTVWQGREAEGVEAFLGGSSKYRQGSKASVDASQQALENSYVEGLITRLEREGVRRDFARGTFDKETWTAMHEIASPEPNAARLAQLPEEAVKIARVLNDINELARTDANIAGAHIKKLPGYVAKQSHDTFKIRKAGSKEWMDFMADNLDMARSFPDVDDATDALGSLYTQFAAGEHLKLGKQPATGLKGFGNIGKRMSHERVLHFKTPEAEFEYHQRFGTGALRENVVYGLQRMAHHTALMRHLGPNAERNLDSVISRLAQNVNRRGSPDELAKFQNKIRKLKRTLWPNITGEVRVPGNATFARVSANVRAAEQILDLGFATASSIPDVGFVGLEARYQGGSMLGGTASALKAAVRGLTSLERRELYADWGVTIDGMKAGVVARFDPSNPMAAGKMSKANSMFFGLNLLRPWTDRMRMASSDGLFHRLTVQSNRSWDGVTPQMQRLLSQYGIDSGKWDLMRAGKQKAVDGRAYMTPEGLNDVPDDAFSAYLATKGTKGTPARIRDLRTELQDQMRSMAYDRAATAVPEPTARGRATMLQGTQSGTVPGEVARHFALYKSFPFMVIQRVLGREIYGRGSDTMGAALRNTNGELVGLAQMIAGSVVLGYAAMSLKDLAKGKEPRNPEDPATWKAAMLQGGGLGIYGDFLFGELKNRFGGTAVSTFLGPTFGRAGDVTNVIGRVMAGDDAAAQTFRLVWRHIPGVNLFYTKAALDYLVYYRMSEMMNPGYLRRMEQRMKRENDQSFLMPPSRTVPYGG